MKKTISVLITFIFLGAAIIFVVLPSKGVLAGDILSSQDAVLKKELPTKVTLDKDSKDDKWADVEYNHETHSVKNYSPDGKAIVTCVECHHTDQPESALKPPLKKSERAVPLTLEVLKAPDALGVKLCRACHFQEGTKGKVNPEVTYANNPQPLKMNNENAYHENCRKCHDKAIVARPELKEKIGGSEDGDKICAKCHKRIEE